MGPPSFRWIPIVPTFNPTSPYSTPLGFNSTPTFVGIIFDGTLSFYKHASLPNASLLLHLKALRCISAFSWGPSYESHSMYKLLLWPLFTFASSKWFTILRNFQYQQVETPSPVIPSPVNSRSLLFYFSDVQLILSISHSDSFLPVFLLADPFSPNFLFYFRFGRLKVISRLSKSSWKTCMYESTCPLILSSSSPREALVAYSPPSPLATHLSSMWSSLFIPF